MFEARPTVYRGVTMRSRTEAQFAAVFLDGWQMTEGWDYEPQAFQAADGRQYLPDFRLQGNLRPVYVEVKHHQVVATEIEQAMALMEVVWESEPTAGLLLALWDWQKRLPFVLLSAVPEEQAGTLDQRLVTLWRQVIGPGQGAWAGAADVTPPLYWRRKCLRTAQAGVRTR